MDEGKFDARKRDGTRSPARASTRTHVFVADARDDANGPRWGARGCAFERHFAVDARAVDRRRPSVRARAMDFAGQRLSERLSAIGVGVGAAVSFAYGYTRGDYDGMIRLFFASVLVTGFITIPAWPFLYARNPVRWRESKPRANNGEKRRKKRRG